MVSCGDHGELEEISHGVCDGFERCSYAVTRDTESTGCIVGRARQVVV